MFGDDCVCVCGGGGGARREGGRPNPLFSRCVHVKDFRARGGGGGGVIAALSKTRNSEYI